ncbi:MAG: MFS transporter [Pseudomonadota bacterium]
MNDTAESVAPVSRTPLDPNGMAARTILAFLATAGLFYVNIMPAMVDGLINGIGFTPQQAGDASSANVGGALFGALGIAMLLLVRTISWRPVSYAMLVLLIAIDVFSLFVTSPELMVTTRFVHGFVGGALVGVGFYVIARTFKPDKTFGVLLVVQFGLGGLGNLLIPRLVPAFGVEIVFYTLIAFSLVTAAMVPLLGDYALTDDEKRGATKSESIRWAPLSLTLLALFLFQAGNMGLFAFIIGLGESYALDREFITWTLAASGWIGIGGAALVVMLQTTYGRTLPLTIAIIVTVIGTFLLHASDVRTVFFLANCVIGVTWAFVIPYLLGLCAAFDKAGRMAALGGAASKAGLTFGPWLAGRVLVDDSYGLMINIGAVAIAVSAAACIVPALLQDRLAKQAEAG